MSETQGPIDKSVFLTPSPSRGLPFQKAISKDLDLHVHFGIRAGGGESVTRHYCAVFESSDGALVESPPFAVPPLPDIESGSLERLSGELVFPVLVPVGKLAESKERV